MKYIIINGSLLKGIVEGKYKDITWEKVKHNKYNVKSGNDGIMVHASKEQIRFLEELLWQLGFALKED